MSLLGKLKSKLKPTSSQTKPRVVSQKDIRDFDADPFRFYYEHEDDAESFSYQTKDLEIVIKEFHTTKNNNEKLDYFQNSSKITPAMKIALFFKAMEICKNKINKSSCKEYVKNIFIPLDIIKINNSTKTNDGKAEVILKRYESKLPFKELMDIFFQTNVIKEFDNSVNKNVFYNKSGEYLKRAIILYAIHLMNVKINNKNDKIDISRISDFVENPFIKTEILKEVTKIGTKEKIYENVNKYYDNLLHISIFNNDNLLHISIFNNDSGSVIHSKVLKDAKYYKCPGSIFSAIFYGLLITISNADDANYGKDCISILTNFFEKAQVSGKFYGKSNYKNKSHIIGFLNNNNNNYDIDEYNTISQYIDFIFTEYLKDIKDNNKKIYAMSRLLKCSGCDIVKYNDKTSTFNNVKDPANTNGGRDYCLPSLKTFYYLGKYYGVSYKIDHNESGRIQRDCGKIDASSPPSGPPPTPSGLPPPPPVNSSSAPLVPPSPPYKPKPPVNSSLSAPISSSSASNINKDIEDLNTFTSRVNSLTKSLNFILGKIKNKKNIGISENNESFKKIISDKELIKKRLVSMKDDAEKKILQLGDELKSMKRPNTGFINNDDGSKEIEFKKLKTLLEAYLDIIKNIESLGINKI